MSAPLRSAALVKPGFRHMSSNSRSLGSHVKKWQQSVHRTVDAKLFLIWSRMLRSA